MKLVGFLLVLLFGSAGSALAFDVAGLQPVAPYGVFSTFGTETVPKNKMAFELGVDKSKDPSFYRFTMSGAYGITEAMEFIITAPYVYHFEDNVDGMEDIAFGFRHRIYDEGKYGPSFAYVLSAAMDNGREEFGTGGRYGGGIILSKRVGPFLGHANLFYESPGRGPLGSELTIRGGVELAAAHSFKVLGEVIARKSGTGNHYDHVETRFGYRIRTTDSLFTTLGVGIDLKKRAPEYRILFSVSFVPPPKKKPVRKIVEEE